MRIYYIILLTICLFGSREKANAQEIINVAIEPIFQNNVTDTIISLVRKEALTIKRVNKKIVATAYYYLDCGEYSATANKKDESIWITVNNAGECKGKRKYYKCQAVINNPDNIQYKIIFNEAFTFLKDGEKIIKLKNVYPLNDIDNDRIKDTAIVHYDQVINHLNDTIADCGRGVCLITASFKPGIPDITKECYYMTVEPLTDLDGDGNDEIVIATHWFVGGWHDVHLYSLKNKAWHCLTSVHTFSDEESDAARVKKDKKGYYIEYKTWDEEMASIIIKKKKIPIKRTEK